MTTSTTNHTHLINEIYKCDLCSQEIVAIMTLVEFKTKICSNHCLVKAVDGKVIPYIITFPLHKMEMSSTPLNRINSFNLQEYLQSKVVHGSQDKKDD